ncbi:thioredoxin [Roseospira marina]|uniref:Thioredoxin n=1 Tax=Roseospira marina TaxID=140057 RepID=A0A5M6I812_9PROT|nr:thioredoxin [Roseospira marina]KAA5603888.1 thioredoxin [Roseospira marina]MBB4313752.1 putative thioredoxin [Roseospira marina]MBB5086914.1 putative thioredoxin [Roseospira marina]
MALILDGEGTTVSTSAPTDGGDLIKEGTTETFMTDVIEASKSVPVVVDFWAPWCEPCKTLGPMLEKLVRQMNGAVRMVKINVDENQQLAAQLRVQSVPTVYGFKQGQPIDAFAGALPESQLKQFLSGLTGGASNPIDAALEEAKQILDGGDFEGALVAYRQILEHDQGNAKAIGGYLRALIANGQNGEAAQIIAQLPEDYLKDPDIAAAKMKLELSQETAGPVAELRTKVDADPNDHQARYDLANALYAADQVEAAVDELLELFWRDRTWSEDAARQRLLKIFEALGPGDPVAASGRRRLSSLVFA